MCLYQHLICGCICKPMISCMSRTKIVLQSPIVVLVSPDIDRLPRLRDAKQPILRRGKGATIPATPAQWNNMRAALGPNVPNKA